MFLYVIPIVYALVIIPALCIDAINRKDIDPSMQALAILILAPFIWFLVNALRLNL